MKTALSIVAAVALGCASTVALAQQDNGTNGYERNGFNGYEGNGYQGNYRDNGYQNENQGNYENRDIQNGAEQGAPVYLSPREIAHIQVELRRDGFDPGRVDGTWGGETSDAVARFQRAHGIDPSGELNLRTIHVLHVAAPERPMTANSRAYDRNTGYGGYDRYDNGSYDSNQNSPTGYRNRYGSTGGMNDQGSTNDQGAMGYSGRYGSNGAGDVDGGAGNNGH